MSDTVDIELAHFYTTTDGKENHPGAVIKVTEDEARRLIEGAIGKVPEQKASAESDPPDAAPTGDEPPSTKPRTHRTT